MANVVKLAPFAAFSFNGNFSTYLDRDGQTAWCFQWQNVGFARCHLSDGSVVFQGNLFNQSPGGPLILDFHGDASIVFAQDDIGHYYTMQNNALVKAHVGSGPAGNLWNGLLIVDGSLDLSAFIVGANSFQAWADPINPASNGTRYFSGLSTGTPPFWLAIDADTLAIVGNWVLTEQTMGNCPTWGHVTNIQLINGAGTGGAPQLKITVTGTPGLGVADAIIMWGLTAHSELNGVNPLTVTGVAGSIITVDAPSFTGHTNFNDPELSGGATVFSQVFGINGIGSFLDKNGDLWGVWGTGRISTTGYPNDGAGPDWSCFLVHWHPADGTTSPPSAGMAGPFLNATVHFVSGQTMGTSIHGTPSTASANFCAYNGLSHSVVLGNNTQGIPNSARTGQLSSISLNAFTQIAFLADNGTNIWAGTFDPALSAFGLGTQPDGSFAAPGDTGLSGQIGGILNIFDGTSLALKQSINITSIINAALSNIISPVDTGFGLALPQFAQMRYSSRLSGVLVTYEFSSPAFWVTFPLLSPGLSTIRDYCQAYGIFVSGVMDTQRPAADWLNDLADIANAAPVWNGSQLNFVPRCEVSTAGNGAIFIAATASGPVATLDDSKFIAKNGPPVTITRTRPADAFNVLPMEHINRANQYNHEVTTIRDQSDIFARGPIAATTRQLLWIHDKPTALKVGWPLVRRSTLVGRLSLKFALPVTFSWLDNYDLVALMERFLGLNGYPCRITEISENETYELQITAEPFYYGAHSPTPQLPSALPVTGWMANPQADPGSVNPPIIFEPVQHLNQFSNSGSIMIIVSGSSPNYAGTNVHMSKDDGQTYQQVGTLQNNPVQGLTVSADFPATPDPDTADTLHVDLTESAGTLNSFTADQRDLFQSLCYVEGGGMQPGGTLVIPYELVAYADATLVTGNQYNLTPTIRRGVYQTPVADHPIGSKFAFVNINEMVQIVLDPSLIGKTLLFKFTAFNVFLQNEQDISDTAVVAYPYTPIGIGSVIQFPQPVFIDKWLAILPDDFELQRKGNDEAVFETYSLVM